MQARRKTRLYIVLAVLAGLGLTVSLTLYALSSNIDLFSTPRGNYLRQNGNPGATPYRAAPAGGGYVQPGSSAARPANLDVRFKLCMTPAGWWTSAIEGILPDLFREGQGVVAQGVLDGESGILPPSRCWPNMMKITRRRR
ncbi:cytochrome c maturation protein CcmE [Klebsiella pneumoniae subsp. pneumoniae]|nr:cytochrome c maturation protein CcmE [Klebsiella pneumoniae subsp. pneumoniae]